MTQIIRSGADGFVRTFGGFMRAAVPSDGLQIIASHLTAWTDEPIHFLAHRLGAQIDKEASYLWSLDDEGATYQFWDETHFLPNNRNMAYGPGVEHTWTTPGTKQVQVTQFENGVIRQATITVEVAEPQESEFSRILYVSFENNFTGAPAAGGAIEHITNASDLRDRVRTSDVWIRFRAGEEFDLGIPEHPGPRILELTRGTFRLDAWGEGEKPFIYASRENDGTSFLIGGNASGSNRAIRVCMVGLSADGGYRPRANPGSQPAGAWEPTRQRLALMDWFPTAQHHSVQHQGARISTFRCSFGGFIKAFDVRGPESTLCLSDSEIRDWLDYGIFVGGGGGELNVFALSGGFIQQDPDVESFDQKEPLIEDQDPAHGPLRISTPPKRAMSIYGTSFRARGGWFSNLGEGQPMTEQPCIRLNNDGGGDEDSLSSVVGVILDGGGLNQLVWGRSNSGINIPNMGNLIVDMVESLPTKWHTFVLRTFGGSSIRNVRCVMPDLPGLLGGARALVEIAPKTPNVGDAAYEKPVRVYSNTFVSLQSLENSDRNIKEVFRLAEAVADGANITIYDNLLFGPERPNAAELPDWGPLSAEFRPLAGSAATGGAQGPSPYFDLRGRVRATPATVGAEEFDDEG